MSNGIISIDGELKVSFVDLANGYVPAPGDRFRILTTSSQVLGTFTSENLPASGGGWEFTWQPVNYNDPQSVVLELATVALIKLEGDFNLNGIVDAADYVAWRNHLGDAGEAALNGNGDGVGGVDMGDYTLWKNNFGSIATASGVTAEHAVVPEPVTMLLLLGGLVAALVPPWSTTVSSSGLVPRRS